MEHIVQLKKERAHLKELILKDEQLLNDAWADKADMSPELIDVLEDQLMYMRDYHTTLSERIKLLIVQEENI